MSTDSSRSLSRRDLLVSLAVGGISTLGPPMGAGQGAPTVASQTSQPALSPSARKLAKGRLLEYFRGTGPLLLRPAEGILKYPSLSCSLPGKEYSTQLWDWDTLWTSRGLFRLAHLTEDGPLRERILLHAEGSLSNFLDHPGKDGRLPIMMAVDDPDPLSSFVNGQAQELNQAKPVMAQLALLIAEEQESVTWLASRFDRLLEFHESWTRTNRSATGLLVWSNDVGIGNDNDPTTFGRPPFSSANLLLNCLFFEELRAAAELSRRLGRPLVEQQRLSAQAADQAANIQKYCWDPRDRFYYTVDVQCTDQRQKWLPKLKPGMAMSWNCLPLRLQVFTGFLPLWCGIAKPQQATELIQEHYLRDQRFRADWGVRSLSNRETMYDLQFSSNPSNWLGPVWIVANYFVWKALKNYGFDDLATELADKTINLLASDLEKNGSLNEYYHPDTGAPLSHHGFMDWNLLVLEMMG